MVKPQSVAKAAIGSALITLVTVAGTLLYLMFSTGQDEFGEKKGLFGSLVFEMTDKGNGVSGITTGIDNPVPILVLFLGITVTLTMMQTIYQILKQRRGHLLNNIPSS